MAAPNAAQLAALQAIAQANRGLPAHNLAAPAANPQAPGWIADFRGAALQLPRPFPFGHRGSGTLFSWLEEIGSDAGAITAYVFDRTCIGITSNPNYFYTPLDIPILLQGGPAAAANQGQPGGPPNRPAHPNAANNGAFPARANGAYYMVDWSIALDAEKQAACFGGHAEAITSAMGVDVRAAIVELCTAAGKKDITRSHAESWGEKNRCPTKGNIFYKVVNYWGATIGNLLESNLPNMLNDAWDKYRVTIASGVSIVVRAATEYGSLFTQAEKQAIANYQARPYERGLLDAIPQMAFAKADLVATRGGYAPDGWVKGPAARHLISGAQRRAIIALLTRRDDLLIQAIDIANMDNVAIVDAGLAAVL